MLGKDRMGTVANSKTLVLALIILVVSGGVLAACGGDDDTATPSEVSPEESTPAEQEPEPNPTPASEAADPAAVIEGYVDAYNARDVDALMALFAADAVITDHPIATSTEGTEAIEQLQASDIDASVPNDAYEISNVQVTGTTVRWDHIWRASDGTVWIGEGNEAVVEDGKIVSWAFAAVSEESDGPASSAADTDRPTLTFVWDGQNCFHDGPMTVPADTYVVVYENRSDEYSFFGFGPVRKGITGEEALATLGPTDPASVSDPLPDVLDGANPIINIVIEAEAGTTGEAAGDFAAGGYIPTCGEDVDRDRGTWTRHRISLEVE